MRFHVSSDVIHGTFLYGYGLLRLTAHENRIMLSAIDGTGEIVRFDAVIEDAGEVVISSDELRGLITQLEGDIELWWGDD